MSMLRLLAGSPPKSILGVTHVTDVVPIIDRMKRHHSQENCSTSFLEFENGAAATMIYSNVIHARSLGRKNIGIAQIDGTRGAIVETPSTSPTPPTTKAAPSPMPMNHGARSSKSMGARSWSASASSCPIRRSSGRTPTPISVSAKTTGAALTWQTSS